MAVYSSITDDEISPHNTMYSYEQEKCGFVLGDYVSISERIPLLEQSWHNNWIKNLEYRIGCTGNIVKIDKYSGINVEFSDGNTYTFPYWCVQKTAIITVTLEIKVGNYEGSLVIPHGIFEELQRGEKFHILNHKVNA